jgi:hypothetical protein
VSTAATAASRMLGSGALPLSVLADVVEASLVEARSS